MTNTQVGPLFQAFELSHAKNGDPLPYVVWCEKVEKTNMFIFKFTIFKNHPSNFTIIFLQVQNQMAGECDDEPKTEEPKIVSLVWPMWVAGVATAILISYLSWSRYQ